MSVVTYFPDTNFLLQCRMPAELPWRGVTEATEVHLVVVPEVGREIDRHKGGGNARRARRAREWVSIFRTARSGDRTAELRAADPKVVLVLAPPRLLPEDSTGLLGDTGDGRVVREAVAWRDASGATDCALLTDDGGAADLAEAGGLACVMVPLDPKDREPRWRLPPEQDPRDKEIRLLKDQLGALKSLQPHLEAEFVDASGKALQRLHLEVVDYPTLTDAQIEDLVAEVAQRWPEARNFDAPPPGGGQGAPDRVRGRAEGFPSVWYGPDRGAIARYRNEARPKWLAQVRRGLGQLPQYLEAEGSVRPVTLRLRNVGGATATNLSVLIQTTPALAMMAVDKEAMEGVRDIRLVPDPPRPPEGRYVTGDGFMKPRRAGMAPAAYLAAQAPPVWEVDDLRWREWPGSPVVQAELLCAGFRHRAPAEERLLHLVVLKRSSQRVSGVVKVTLHSTNAPEPVVLNLPCTISWRTGDTVAAARDAIARGTGEVPEPTRSLARTLLIARYKDA